MENEKKNTTDEVLFFEPHAAAQSLKSGWTRMASTYGCMRILLSPETLTIKPHWFAVGFTALLGLDLWHEIPVTAIERVEEAGRWFGYGVVEVHFVSAGGEKRAIRLYLKNHRRFVDALSGLLAP